jgi:hypothetical protein
MRNGGRRWRPSLSWNARRLTNRRGCGCLPRASSSRRSSMAPAGSPSPTTSRSPSPRRPCCRCCTSGWSGTTISSASWCTRTRSRAPQVAGRGRRRARVGETLRGRSDGRRPRHAQLAGRRAAGGAAEHGYNVVIHEFIHKIDMRDGAAGWLPAPAYPQRPERMALGDPATPSLRASFASKSPWPNVSAPSRRGWTTYGAGSPAEFFAVACEAYFVNRERFTQDFASMTVLFDKFFIPAK